MRILTVSRGALLCFLVSLLFAVSFCHGGNGNKVVEVVGTGECADCAQSNFKTSQAFSGLRVTIDCKPENGEFKTRGVGELDEEGKFKVSLPEEIVEDEILKEECYAQLHSASATPCPAHGGLESSKIIFKTKNEDKHTFGLPGKLKFSPVTCASAFFWPHFKHPPLSKFPHPKFKLPPSKSFGHPFPFPPKVLPPKYKKPCPPLTPKPPVIKKPYLPKPPVFKKHPPVPIYKPKPPVPIYKPKPPVPIYKPKPPVPIYKPKPPVPIYKPKPPVPIYKPKPPVPIYKPKPPIFIKPLPPHPKIPPFYKKPCPPLPKHPPISKIPPKYFHHPKFGKWPPLPPFASHP